MYARHFFLAAALLGAMPPAHACSLRLGFDQWRPYIYRDTRAQLVGLDVELAQAIFKEAGCTLVIGAELPGARRSLLFQQGQIDLLLSASDTPERRVYARFSISYRNELVGIFTSPANLARYRQIDTFETLSKQAVTLLVPKQGWYGDAFVEASPKLALAGKLTPYNNYYQGVRMFNAGRAGLIMGDMVALRDEAKEQGVEIAALPFIVLRAPVHLMLNKATTSQADLDRLNGAIARLEKRGTLALIREKYGER